MGCGQTGTASPARAVAWPLQIDPFIGVGELALFVAMADCWPPPSGWSRGAYGLFIAAAVASMFGGPVRQKLTLGGDGGGVFDLDNRGAVTLTVTRATTAGPPAAEVADALAGRSHIAAVLGDLPASSRASLSRMADFFNTPAGQSPT